MLPDKAIKVTNIDLIETTTFVKVRGDLYIDRPKTIYADNITPHPDMLVQPRVKVNGNLDIQGTLTTTGPTTITPGDT